MGGDSTDKGGEAGVVVLGVLAELLGCCRVGTMSKVELSWPGRSRAMKEWINSP